MDSLIPEYEVYGISDTGELHRYIDDEGLASISYGGNVLNIVDASIYNPRLKGKRFICGIQYRWEAENIIIGRGNRGYQDNKGTILLYAQGIQKANNIQCIIL
jgi:hypothetical protein